MMIFIGQIYEIGEANPYEKMLEIVSTLLSFGSVIF